MLTMNLVVVHKMSSETINITFRNNTSAEPINDKVCLVHIATDVDIHITVSGY